MLVLNEQNNRSSTLEARDLYQSLMKDAANQKGVSSEELKRQHVKASDKAITHFKSFRNKPTEETKDSDLERLQEVC